MTLSKNQRKLKIYPINKFNKIKIIKYRTKFQEKEEDLNFMQCKLKI